MARKKSYVDATPSNVKIETVEQDGIMTVKNILPKVEDSIYFTVMDNDTSPIFNPGIEIGKTEEKVPMFGSLSANKYYFYNLTSALIYAADKQLDKILPEDQKPERYVPEKKDERVKAVLDQWKEENKDNDKMYDPEGESYLKPAKKHYTSKEGKALTDFKASDKDVSLSDLSALELATLYQFLRGLKKETIEDPKKANRENNPWVGWRPKLTPEGWRTLKTLEAMTKRKFGLITEQEMNEKIQWAASSDFKQGWNFSKPVSYTEIFTDIPDKPSEKALEAVARYNEAFCMLALTRDKMVHELEQQ